jgi:hypothetical protein
MSIYCIILTWASLLASIIESGNWQFWGWHELFCVRSQLIFLVFSSCICGTRRIFFAFTQEQSLVQPLPQVSHIDLAWRLICVRPLPPAVGPMTAVSSDDHTISKLSQVGPAGDGVPWRPTPRMLHLVGHPGQDTGPLEHGRAATTTVAAVCAIVIPKYDDASTRSKSVRILLGMAAKQGTNVAIMGGGSKPWNSQRTAPACRCCCYHCHCCHCQVGGKLTGKGATATPRGGGE